MQLERGVRIRETHLQQLCRHQGDPSTNRVEIALQPVVQTMMRSLGPSSPQKSMVEQKSTCSLLWSRLLSRTCIYSCSSLLKKPRLIHRTGDDIGHSFCQSDDIDAEINWCLTVVLFKDWLHTHWSAVLQFYIRWLPDISGRWLTVTCLIKCFLCISNWPSFSELSYRKGMIAMRIYLKKDPTEPFFYGPLISNIHFYSTTIGAIISCKLLWNCSIKI